MDGRIVHNMPSAEYHAAPGWSSSAIRAGPTLAHAHEQLTHPRVDTNALRFGRALHCAILEPLAFLERVGIAPDVDRRTKDGKAAWAAFEAAAAGRDHLTVDEKADADGMVKSVHAHRIAGPMVRREDGRAEVSVFWTDKDAGEKCRARIDWLVPGVVVDIKTTTDAGPEAFAREAWGYGYFRQLAWYIDGITDATGQPHTGAIVAVEKSAPYVAAVYMVPDDAMDIARAENRLALRRLVKATRENVWPGYENLTDLYPPEWAIKRHERTAIQ